MACTKGELICFLHSVSGHRVYGEDVSIVMGDAAELLLDFIADEDVTRAYHIAIGLNHSDEWGGRR